MMRSLLVLCLAVAAWACQAEADKGADAPAKVATINATCPSDMAGDVDAAAGTYDWNGKLVGFCCESCKPKFAALSEPEKIAALTKAGVKLDG